MTVFMNANREMDALRVYDEYEHLHNDTSNMLGIKCCIVTKNFHRGNHIIMYRIKNGNDDYMELKNTVIDFYGTFNNISKAWDIFGSVPNDKKEVVMINAMMKALINNTQSIAALKLYDKYQEITDNDDVSHLTAIKACVNTKDITKLTQIHDKVKDTENLSILTALIDFYGVVGDVDAAKHIFDSIDVDERNTVCINVMLKVLVKNDMNKEVLELYDTNENLQDDISHLSALMACRNLENQEKGQDIHRKILKLDKYVSIEVENVLIEFYGHFGNI